MLTLEDKKLPEKTLNLLIQLCELRVFFTAFKDKNLSDLCGKKNN